MSDQLNRMEEMLATLIKMQAANNAKIEELSEEMKEFKVDLKDTKETLHTFRSETKTLIEQW